jgi:homoserine dehydrogenase (EC 1.1.1.3)
MNYAKKLGYRIKLIGQAKQLDNGIGIDVSATLVNKKELVANVMGAYNVIEIANDYVDNVIYYGKGAGRYVTASAVVSDIMKTCQQELWCHDYTESSAILPITKSKYYVRSRKALDIDYETYYTEKTDHVYITHEIELKKLQKQLMEDSYTIFKVRG